MEGNTDITKKQDIKTAEVVKPNNPRLNWIDWMKTLAMYFIVAGHCSVPGNKYIYVFSVPCFFVLSGFLSKKETVFYLFWKKLWWNLLVPMGLMFFINMFIYFVVQYINGTFEWKYLYQTPFLALVGMQGNNYAAGGLKGLWFVYTLVLCKLLLQFSPAKHQNFFLLVINTAFLIIAWILNRKGVELYNAVVDVLLAMPFFTMGFMARPFKKEFSSVSTLWLLILLIIGMFGVWLCGRNNDIVMLYRCSFGSNLALCMIGGMAGTILIYSISMMLKSYLSDFVSVIGGGTIVILGFHFVIIQISNQLLHISGWWLYVKALLIFIMFYPVILFVKKHIPVIYGKNRK